MNRKLHNTILAFSISSGFLMLGLMAAVPLPGGQPALQAQDALADGPRRMVTREALEARARSYEADMARAVSAGEMIALSSNFAAAVAAEAALAAVHDELIPDEARPRADAEDTAPPRRANRRRNGLAMPYFSFAHGLRGGSGS